MGRELYGRDSLEVAPELLNKVLVAGPCRARIVEVEAYRGADDPASHAYRGLTPRTTTMFGPPGHLYVYLTYGMHHCANVVCGDDGLAMAVLLRGLTPLQGLETMRARRPAARTDPELCAGPGRLCQALAIDRSFDGADLVGVDRGVWIGDDGVAPPAAPASSPRIGVTAAADRPWRFTVPGAVGLSRRK